MLITRPYVLRSQAARTHAEGQQALAREGWEEFGAIIVVRSLDEAAILANRIASEHVELALDDPQALLGWLAEVFPGLDDSQLQERMARLLFAASVWGRLHGGA